MYKKKETQYCKFLLKEKLRLKEKGVLKVKRNETISPQHHTTQHTTKKNYFHKDEMKIWKKLQEKKEKTYFSALRCRIISAVHFRI
jgi:TFIIF-interacting CTD phosphatase-like protein